jgi:hypothetical protein
VRPANGTVGALPGRVRPILISTLLLVLASCSWPQNVQPPGEPSPDAIEQSSLGTAPGQPAIPPRKTIPAVKNGMAETFGSATGMQPYSPPRG